MMKSLLSYPLVSERKQLKVCLSLYRYQNSDNNHMIDIIPHCSVNINLFFINDILTLIYQMIGLNMLQIVQFCMVPIF